jgi:hypothetical protein
LHRTTVGRSALKSLLPENGPRFMPTARYFRDMAAPYREIARRMSDPHAADSMSAIAARHQERADELEQWSGSSVRTPITPDT